MERELRMADGIDSLGAFCDGVGRGSTREV
jgi:hypothetical protein